MRLAATLTTMRDAARQPVALRGTLRDPDATPCDVVILDVSTSGFLAELPAGVAIEPGARVRVAATLFGMHEAIAVRGGDGAHGFVFVRPLGGDALAVLDGEQPSTVMPFPASAYPIVAPGQDAAPATEPEPRISARASLALMTGISLALWLVLAGIVAGATLLG